MLYKTRGIVINYIKFKETSIISRIFTEQFGVQSYIVNGVRSKKGNKIALFQPLTLLDLVVYHKQNANLFRISEIKCSEPFSGIPNDIKRSCVAMFITEVLSKTLKGETDESLFDFVFQSVRVLDHLDQNYENFHLQFLLKLSRYLGFQADSETYIYDQVGHLQLAKGEEGGAGLLDQLTTSGYQNGIRINNTTRRTFLEILLKYYNLHIENFGEVKSVQVLKEVLY